MNSIRDQFNAFIESLQDEICSRLEQIDGARKFREDDWQREGGGGGRTRVLENGKIFEKAGVNISRVHGKLPDLMQKKLDVRHENFFAAGISLVIHPLNPFVPTVHANFRMFELYAEGDQLADSWFGGGADLTPYYIYEEDAVHFHSTFRNSLEPHGKELYPRFREECDRYFYNTHRDEPRGIGGIFFDYLRADEERSREDWFRMVTDCGNAFLDAYIPIVLKRKEQKWEKEHRQWQEVRRGRYVEFNLIHDRGTLFGLKTKGRIESILMSLPPAVQWQYDFHPEAGTAEAETISALHDKNWLKQLS